MLKSNGARWARPGGGRVSARGHQRRSARRTRFENPSVDAGRGDRGRPAASTTPRLSQPETGFGLLRDARPSVVIVGEYTGRAQRPVGFYQPLLRRLFRASASPTVIGSAAQGDGYALPTAPVVLTRRHAVTVETRLAWEIPWIQFTTKAAPCLPLLMSTVKRERGITSAGTDDLYTPTRKVQEAVKGRETLGPPGVIAALGARHWRWRLEVVE